MGLIVDLLLPLTGRAMILAQFHFADLRRAALVRIMSPCKKQWLISDVHHSSSRLNHA